MKIICKKCGDKGFIEENHGLIMVQCDCEAGEAKEIELRGRLDDSNNRTRRDNQPIGGSDSGQSRESKKPKAGKKSTAKVS